MRQYHKVINQIGFRTPTLGWRWQARWIGVGWLNRSIRSSSGRRASHSDTPFADHAERDAPTKEPEPTPLIQPATSALSTYVDVCRKRKDRPDRGSNPGLPKSSKVRCGYAPQPVVGGIINSNSVQYSPLSPTNPGLNCAPPLRMRSRSAGTQSPTLLTSSTGLSPSPGTKASGCGAGGTRPGAEQTRSRCYRVR